MSETKKFRVSVTARTENGFYRCGRHWPASDTEETVSEQELTILRAEKKLSVRVLEESKGDAEDKSEDPKPKPQGQPNQRR